MKAMPPAPAACRLFVIPAREAPVAVIFRRGPSKATQIIRWDTDTDTFEAGSWFHGQLYPERCDVSPDGTKLIYFALNYSYSERNKASEFPGTWTAISKVPWLTALCVWPNADTDYGGGLFETNTKVIVNQWDCWQENAPLDDYPQPEGLEVIYGYPFFDHNWHNLFRLERDGWKPIEPYPWGSIPTFRLQPDGSRKAESTDPNCPLRTPAYIRTVHEKQNPEGSHSLIMTCTYPRHDPDSQFFALRDNQQGTTIRLQETVWADWDKRGRLLYAREGRVFTMGLMPSGELCPHQLADFNASKPARAKAPRWAREW